MRALLQRVSSARVDVERSAVASIGSGLLILLGVRKGDSESDARALAEKCAALRIFSDEEGKMNVSVREIGGEILVVSQFTLYGDTRRGNRPSFSDAAPPEEAERLYDIFCTEVIGLLGEGKVARGIFGAMMSVSLVNDGPVTVIVESKDPPGRGG